MSTPDARPPVLSVQTSPPSAQGRVRARSIESPTFYRDLTPLPSPIVGPPRTPSSHRLGPPPLPQPSSSVPSTRKPYGELTQSLPDPLHRELTRALSVRDPTLELFEAYEHRSLRKLKWKEVRLLGKGSFSRVVLAALIFPSLSSDDDDESEDFSGKELVAVKIVELAGAGGVSRERIESSLKREVDILKVSFLILC